MSILNVGPPDFTPRLVIFDKDGTLIDFNFMWGHWIVELSKRLEEASGVPVTSKLFSAFGYDPLNSRVLAETPLAGSTMALLRRLAVDALAEDGERADAEKWVAQAWFSPDPVKLARPLADLPRVFHALQRSGMRTAVATSDDRTATEATLESLHIADCIDAVVAADEGLPNKPAPDMVIRLCHSLGIGPAETAIVGDGPWDLQMGRAAGVGLKVGVLSGLSPVDKLRPLADVIIPSVGDLI